ncbi:hypothetical protein HMY34_08275 [Thiothrix subterranea]|uniref:hypothetical protein n=1 Tax=Thiothrix subterranea TaxID=2735563 RepID=UPI00192B208B|nr:hypothetical protein [Thiothrix subterranea]QQZ28750.1 hypothetical protein HMY34_08275 [Thiothrix subterranea]
MKPNIINWAYLGLAYVLLNNLLILKGVPDNSSWYNVSLPIIITILAIIAFFGLLSLASWSRITAAIVIGVEAFKTLLIDAYIITYVGFDGGSVLISALIFSIPLLILSYKLHTSISFKG